MTGGRGTTRGYGRIAVRPATSSDRDFILDAAGRLSAFGELPGRAPGEIVEGERRTLRGFFDGTRPGDTLLLAEGDGRPAGFVFLEEKQDYFTGEVHGHVGILAVTAEAEGRGAAGALMRAAESWARAQGYPTLTLNVFDGNHHARSVYEHLGFRPDTVKYLKRL